MDFASISTANAAEYMPRYRSKPGVRERERVRDRERKRVKRTDDNDPKPKITGKKRRGKSNEIKVIPVFETTIPYIDDSKMDKTQVYEIYTETDIIRRNHYTTELFEQIPNQSQGPGQKLYLLNLINRLSTVLFEQQRDLHKL